MSTVATIIGARPQFIKATPLSRALRARGMREVIIHTGQHYDPLMSDVFFQDLGLSTPAYHLGVGSGSHGAQTGRALERVEDVLLAIRPDLALVYGDTNSTLAGALAAAKIHIPVAHIESGLRSFNSRMPEEVNRVLTDHVSTLLFAPTDAAVTNLRREGIVAGVFRTGDVMFDMARIAKTRLAGVMPELERRLGIQRSGFVFATVHRAENTDDPQRWRSVLTGISRIADEIATVVWPVHPRVRDRLDGFHHQNVRLLDPQPYFQAQALISAATAVVTDSGGVQKEAAFHETPCVTVRDETEWIELIHHGVNRTVGVDPGRMTEAVRTAAWPVQGLPPSLFGDGRAADVIADHIQAFVTHTATRSTMMVT